MDEAERLIPYLQMFAQSSCSVQTDYFCVVIYNWYNQFVVYSCTSCLRSSTTSNAICGVPHHPDPSMHRTYLMPYATLPYATLPYTLCYLTLYLMLPYLVPCATLPYTLCSLTYPHATLPQHPDPSMHHTFP